MRKRHPSCKDKHAPALTEEQKAHRDLIEFLSNEVETAQDKMYAEFRKCKHVVHGSPDEAAHCAICNKDMGWFCEDSPDHSCYYFTDGKGNVELRDGTIHKLYEPGSYNNHHYETDDQCLFCSAPDERK